MNDVRLLDSKTLKMVRGNIKGINGSPKTSRGTGSIPSLYLKDEHGNIDTIRSLSTLYAPNFPYNLVPP